MVNTKMTAIADKIRSILGFTGKMGLDAMASNLETEQSNIAAAFTSIESKGGAVPESKVSGNLASAIASIPDGATVQITTGDFTTNNNGSATVNCGFAPDVVFITKNETSEGSRYDCAIPFALSPTSTFDIALWTKNSKYYMYDLRNIKRTSTGFSLSVKGYDDSWSSDTAGNTKFYYTAVKYTE